ncbi:MarR family winged helix-turn-helix transcriptional regulator [Sediminicola luteus]|uniref:MarR family transcriptional regulator n=1 Tax=Sediminicola luteus TaxID=319238 RepID=A0A2A4G6B9_9FLAO|nr:MarR family transcriptional regulator [Sediminicola luteus]PCE63504.1 MarR family transcriptional regulator [Sediminicola luteus]
MEVEKIIQTKVNMPLPSRTAIHLSLVCQSVKERMNLAMESMDTTLQHFNVLRILRGQKGSPINLSGINSRMVTKMSNTSRIVDKLMKKGQVERTLCPNNRREVEIRITDKGLRDLEQMSVIVHQTEQAIFKNFEKEDLVQLNQLLDKF